MYVIRFPDPQVSWGTWLLVKKAPPLPSQWWRWTRGSLSTHSSPSPQTFNLNFSWKPCFRLQRWSFFCDDGMVMFFFQGTIAIDGFSMVLPALDYHHWMFFYRSTIDIDSFPMVFPNSGAMVSDGFDLEKDLKLRIIVTDPILRERCVLFRIQITLLLVSFSCNWTLKYSVFFKI